MSEAGLTRDAFLGGRVQAWQPAKGYRAGTDPVFLAAACPARPGETVLELGCGVGVASLCLGARVEGLHISGVERQPAYADLARRNGLDVVEADLTALPPDLRARSFDHVMANPPYFAEGDGTPARDVGREGAFREDTPLSAWIDTARARLKPKGWLTLIQLAERLPECLTALSRGFGSVAVLPVQSRAGRSAGRVLIRARKGGKAPFRLLAPFLVHERPYHLSDGDDYTALAAAVLRDGASINFQ